jgi:hypothetical protein
MIDDEMFAERLSGWADQVVPRFEVDPDQVVRRARSRRPVTRSATVTAAAVTVAVAGVWAAPGTAWESLVQRPAQWSVGGPGHERPTAAPTTPAPESSPSASTAPTYWYSRIETTWPDVTQVRETWSSRVLPGLTIADGDLTQPVAFGPRDVLGRFRIDGEWVDMLRDPAALPTDAEDLAAVLRDSVEPDRRQGTDDQKIFGMVRDLLVLGGLLPADLRLALWDVAARLSGAEVADGDDSTGRAGRVLVYTAEHGQVRFVGDPATGLLLEMDESWGRTVYLEQRETQEIPVQPTIEMAGCVAWESC